jgi:hypothetical protein
VRKLLLIMLSLLAHPALAITPENGWWWNPTEPGRGFNIETQNGTVFIATFIYEGSGQSVWYSGSGAITQNGTLNTTLMRSDNGQCVGCSYQSPNASPQTGITMQFHSESRATVNWAGAAIPIRRFNFKLGDSYEQVLGEWLFVTGAPQLPVYFGERIAFWGITVEQGIRRIHGHRTGANNQAAVAMSPDFLSAYGFDILALLDSSPDHYTWFAWRWTGLNRIEGRSFVGRKSEEAIDVSLQRLLIGGEGLPFIATRNSSDISNVASASTTST